MSSVFAMEQEIVEKPIETVDKSLGGPLSWLFFAEIISGILFLAILAYVFLIL
jgi:hypothetical protein